MLQNQDVGILVLHGLRESAYPDPFGPFELLLKDLEAYVPQRNFFRYEWDKDLDAAPIGLVIRGILGVHGAPHLNRQFLQYKGENPGIKRWIVVCYSGGGWIFYQWLEGWPVNGIPVRPIESQLDPIILVFTIGSPWHNLYADMIIGDNPRSRSTSKWSLNADTLANALKPGALHVIYSDADTTVWPDNSKFPLRIVTSGLVIQHPPLAGVPHRDLCQNQAVRDYIKTSVAAVVQPIPSST